MTRGPARLAAVTAAALLLSPLPGAAAGESAITAPGPHGPLAGTLSVPSGAARGSVVLILPGSGPTDRDGNNPLGVRAAPYRLLAEGLAARGIASVRIDKRGMFGSAAATPDANAVTIADYVADTRSWIAAIRARTGAGCVWLLGHSEGGLVALATAAGRRDPICGLVLLATAGRPLGAVLRDQLRANPANAPILEAADAAITRLAAGGRNDVADLPAGLRPLFASAVQGFLASAFAADPADLIRRADGPILILQGGRDIQIGEVDARRLADAAPQARLVLLPEVNHVLKRVATVDRAANLAAYGDPDRPLAPGVVEAIADFVRTGSR
ncbi:alpha/beta hydrolase [Allostella sp. ATCC 35155]|nr:alpha/beta hydrolase [Stella sp. ATCC 35155]